jgi:hypothetical protein
MCMIVSQTLKLLMMFDLNFAILITDLLKLIHLVRTLIIRQYQTFSHKPGESLNDCFARFESIVSNLRAVVLLLIPIMNMIKNCSMLLMIMCGV